MSKIENSSDKIFLGFDFGTKNIGVAVGQFITLTATPLKPLKAKQGIPDWKMIDNLIEMWKPNALVVGVPLNVDGSEQHTTTLAKKFIVSLKNKSNLPVYAGEERYSTVAAREEVFNTGGYKSLLNESIDSFAAKIILEEWMKMNS